MELQMDPGMHVPIGQGIYGHNSNNVNNNNGSMPALHDVAFGGYSEEEENSEHDGRSVISENGDTDYDLMDDIDSEEEEEEENSEDDSQVHALIDDLEVKFRMLVAEKIGEAEQFLDDASTFQRLASNSAALEEQNKWTSSPLLESLNQGGEAVEGVCTKEETDSCKHSGEGATKSREGGGSDVGTQTEEDKWLHPQTPVRASTVSGAEKGEEDGGEKTGPDKARVEISQLRDVRESFILQRKHWADQLKQVKETDEDEIKKAESKVYEVEEAIEAIDTAIEFKNEVILGQPPSKIVDNLPPGTSEAQLVTRLESLSVEELQRLLCTYFAKVVELRTSSRRLEKHLEHAENSNDQLSRRLAREHKHSKELHVEYQSRIRLILSSNNPNSALDSYLRRMDDSLAAARKKQHDLERSLTELLVRHGYLVNGADYDVKQVVKMLGIESQLAGTTHRAHDGNSGAGAQPSHSRAWEAPGPKGTKKPFVGPGHRRNGRQLDGHELQRIHHRDARLGDGWERERERDRERDRERERGHFVQQSQPPEVRREKRRLIIQPATAQQPSSHHPHHGSPNTNHHYSHHPPSYGSNPYGYK